MAYMKEQTDTLRIPASCFEAVIFEAPVLRTDLIHVLFPQFEDPDTYHKYGPCRWSPQDSDFPSAGDSAIVTVSDQGGYWILNWFPA